MSSPSADRPPLTDSAWFWICLFCTAGLMALVSMSPKFDIRQAKIERQYQGRQRAAQQSAGQQPSTPMSTRENTQITLLPLYVVLAAALCVAWCVLYWKHFHRGTTAPEGHKPEKEPR